MIYRLDTSALLAHYRQESGWEAVQEIFADGGAQILIASVTIAELARRMRELGAGEPDIRETLTDYRVLFSEVIAVDDAIAWAAFQIGCRTSTRLPLIDALIAASAQARGACLVHRDAHLAAIPADLVDQLRLPDPVPG